MFFRFSGLYLVQEAFPQLENSTVRQACRDKLNYAKFAYQKRTRNLLNKCCGLEIL